MKIYTVTTDTKIEIPQEIPQALASLWSHFDRFLEEQYKAATKLRPIHRHKAMS